MSQQPDTLTLNLEKLYANWQPKQKNTVSQEIVDTYKKRIAGGEPVSPIIIEGIIRENGKDYIRTADGRHRIAALHQLGRTSIEAIDTPGAREAQLMFGL